MYATTTGSPFGGGVYKEDGKEAQQKVYATKTGQTKRQMS